MFYFLSEIVHMFLREEDILIVDPDIVEVVMFVGNEIHNSVCFNVCSVHRRRKGETSRKLEL